MQRRWLDAIFLLGIILLLPVYRYMHHTHLLVQTAKKEGTWEQIPSGIGDLCSYMDAIKKQADILSVKLEIQGTRITMRAQEDLSIYCFLAFIHNLPALSILSFKKQKDKNKFIAVVDVNVPKKFKTKILLEPAYKTTESFYSPRFFYVNASAEVDGKKQIWVNGQNYGASCPWPLYHTFDKQTGVVKKGDLRPRLSLTSKE